MNKLHSTFLLIEHFLLIYFLYLLNVMTIFSWAFFSSTKNIFPLTSFDSNLNESFEKMSAFSFWIEFSWNYFPKMKCLLNFRWFIEIDWINWYLFTYHVLFITIFHKTYCLHFISLFEYMNITIERYIWTFAIFVSYKYHSEVSNFCYERRLRKQWQD